MSALVLANSPRCSGRRGGRQSPTPSAGRLHAAGLRRRLRAAAARAPRPAQHRGHRAATRWTPSVARNSCCRCCNRSVFGSSPGGVTLLDDAYAALYVEGTGGQFVLGPTHEEVVTAVVGAEIESYRDVPRLVYQVAAKFRDEARPRFGLVRGREFLMKDAYSFDADPEANGGHLRRRRRGIPPHARSVPARSRAGRGVFGRLRRRRQPRVHGSERRGRGPIRPLPELCLMRPTSRSGGRPAPQTLLGLPDAHGGTPHARPARRRGGRRVLRGSGPYRSRHAQVHRVPRRRRARWSRWCPVTAR